jgi:hypothetical protein
MIALFGSPTLRAAKLAPELARFAEAVRLSDPFRLPVDEDRGRSVLDSALGPNRAESILRTGDI